MPGLRLTKAQVERLCTTDELTSASALRALVDAGFLIPMADGSYGRTDIVAGVAGGSAAPAARRNPAIRVAPDSVSRRTGKGRPWRAEHGSIFSAAVCDDARRDPSRSNHGASGGHAPFTAIPHGGRRGTP